MYHFLKKTVSAVVSKKFLFEYETKFRSLIYPFYKGTNYHCPICKKGLSRFLSVHENKDLLCPNCGSLSRTRRLYELVNNLHLPNAAKVLDFSPSRSFYRILKANPKIEYITTDLSGDFIADQSYDITNINCPSDTFVLIICYHILEHVPDDFKAMSELFRVLKKNGIVFLQTPFKSGEIYEDFSITTPKERLKHFGQEDHVRIYSVKSLKERLEKVGFRVEIFSEWQPNEHLGLLPNETVFILKK